MRGRMQLGAVLLLALMVSLSPAQAHPRYWQRTSRSLAQAAAPPPPPNATVCTPSSLGYECQAALGGVMLHWSLGVAPPSITASSGRRLSAGTANTSYAGMLHMAAVGQTTGYVAVAFAESAGNMPHNDIVLGWVAADGAVAVGTYYASSADLSPGNQVSPSWASLMSVQQAGGATTLRFSRALVDAGAKVSAALDTTAGIQMNWAVGSDGQTSISQHTAAGGSVVNLLTGVVGVADSAIVPYVRTHGVLMTVAWMLLLPLGSLLPAHRWALGDAKWGSKHVWFVLHMSFQLTGVALFVAGYVIAYTQLSSVATPGNVGSAHEIIGGGVMGLAGIQVILGFWRPAPGVSRLRRLWEAGHHNVGRLSILAAWANIYIGIYIFHVGFQESLVLWVAPVASLNGVLVLLAGALAFVSMKRLRQRLPIHAQSEEGKAALAYTEMPHLRAADSPAPSAAHLGDHQGAVPTATRLGDSV